MPEQSLVVYVQSSIWVVPGDGGGAQVEGHTSAPQSPVQVTSALETDIS